MTSQDAQDFAEMALALHEEPTLDETVDRVLEHALRAVGADHAGVLFVHKRTEVETVAATDQVVARFDRIQVEHGDGPDLELVREPGTSVLVHDASSDERWPRWAAALTEAGVHSMIGTRLHTSTTTIGSLNLYASAPHAFSAEDCDVAHILARHAAVALSTARATANLWKAIDGRRLIGQAQGILMERFALDPDQAFNVLRRYSQDRNVKLSEVARRLVTTRRLPD